MCRSGALSQFKDCCAAVTTVHPGTLESAALPTWFCSGVSALGTVWPPCGSCAEESGLREGHLRARPSRPCLLPTRPQHGEVLPLKIVTYAAVSLSLAALLVAFVLLALVRTLHSNLHSSHRNLVAALFFSQLVFLSGVTQTGNPVRPPPATSTCPGPTCHLRQKLGGRRAGSSGGCRGPALGGRSGALGLSRRLCAERELPLGPPAASPDSTLVMWSEGTVTRQSSEPCELPLEL